MLRTQAEAGVLGSRSGMAQQGEPRPTGTGLGDRTSDTALGGEGRGVLVTCAARWAAWQPSNGQQGSG